MSHYMFRLKSIFQLSFRDPEFRDKLISDPKSAVAARFKIALTDQEVNAIISYASKIRVTAEQCDRAIESLAIGILNGGCWPPCLLDEALAKEPPSISTSWNPRCFGLQVLDAACRMDANEPEKIAELMEASAKVVEHTELLNGAGLRIRPDSFENLAVLIRNGSKS